VAVRQKNIFRKLDGKIYISKNKSKTILKIFGKNIQKKFQKKQKSKENKTHLVQSEKVKKNTKSRKIFQRSWEKYTKENTTLVVRNIYMYRKLDEKICKKCKMAGKNIQKSSEKYNTKNIQNISCSQMTLGEKRV